MQIQLEQIDIDMMKAGGGKISSPFRAYWNNKNGELLVLASGITHFELAEGIVDNLFDEIKKM